MIKKPHTKRPQRTTNKKKDTRTKRKKNNTHGKKKKKKPTHSTHLTPQSFTNLQFHGELAKPPVTLVWDLDQLLTTRVGERWQVGWHGHSGAANTTWVGGFTRAQPCPTA